MYLGSPQGSCGLDKVDQSACRDFTFPRISLNVLNFPSVFHCSPAANNLSWSQEGNASDYIRSCDYVAWLPFFHQTDTFSQIWNPPPEKKTHFSHHVAATRRELVRRRWCKGGWTEKDRRWKKRDKMNGDRNIRWQSDKEDEGTFGPDHPFAVTPDSFRMRAQDLREFQNCICEQRLLILPPSLGISF